MKVRGVSSFDVSQGVHWVTFVHLLFVDQYMLLLEDMYEERFTAFHFHSLVAYF